MFAHTPFEGDLSNWKVTIKGFQQLWNMFQGTPLQDKGQFPQWYLKIRDNM
jgi:hypothetical protein